MTSQHVVVLGSSFAAGPGIDPIVDNAARRSGRNYGSIVADKLGARLTDLSVSGATTDNILHTPQQTSWNPWVAPFRPQIEGVPEDAGIILITAGGNNLQYSGGTIKAACVKYLKSSYATWLLGCLLGYQDPIPVVGKKELEGATAGLVAVVEAARRKAPSAKVVLVDYLTVFSDGSTPENAQLHLSLAEIQALRAIGLQLDGVFAEAADRSRALLVKASSLSAENGVGMQDPWVTGFSFRNGAPFHPNAKGMQKVAEQVLHTLEAEAGK